uniref:Uncharacterized protein n=1 Tax=Aegilops tauschii subsp. strangulata TaxID=200361 RepID=A0A453MBK1_AEGTS
MCNNHVSSPKRKHQHSYITCTPFVRTLQRTRGRSRARTNTLPRTVPSLVILLALLNEEEEGEGDDGEGGEDAGGDLDGGGDARDADDVEGGGGRGLAVGDLRAGGVERVGAHVVGGGGDVEGDAVLDPAAGAGVGLLGDLELAGLVFLEVVVGLAPLALLLARRRVAEADLHVLVGGVVAGRPRRVEGPRHRDHVLAGMENWSMISQFGRQC